MREELKRIAALVARLPLASRGRQLQLHVDQPSWDSALATLGGERRIFEAADGKVFDCLRIEIDGLVLSALGPWREATETDKAELVRVAAAERAA